MRGLAGRSILVTGAASGIGRATVARLVEEGATVIAFDRDVGGLAALSPAGVLTVEGDAASAADLERAVAAAPGGLDGLVACAGVSASGTALLDLEEADWDRVHTTNLKGVWLAMRTAGRAMRDAGRGGVIVALASQLAFAGGRGNAAYIASKGGVVALTKTAAVELAPLGIRVVAVAPGAIDTPMLNGSFSRHPDPDAARERSRTRHAMQRFGQAEEIASGIAYMLSDDASFATGTTLVLDGGWLAA